MGLLLSAPMTFSEWLRYMLDTTPQSLAQMHLGDGENKHDNKLMIQFFEWESIGTNEESWWARIEKELPNLAKAGFTQIWFPPANKAMEKAGRGYDAYDLWDLGEFDQKGTIPTRWGTKEELQSAIRKAKELGIDVLMDAVLNHKMGSDGRERFKAVEVNPKNRNVEIAPERIIEGWTLYNFPGRGDKYSALKWTHEHFTGVDWDQMTKKSGVFRIKPWNKHAYKELGNYDFLMGQDIDHLHPAVRKDILDWGPWVLNETGANGFRLDACKHYDAYFIRDFLRTVRAQTGRQKLFAVGEFWINNASVLSRYLSAFNGMLAIFDVPLHDAFHQASNRGAAFDLRIIFRDTLVQKRPGDAVTFVENHDTVTGQSLASEVGPEFKPIAYALILLRPAGHPCVYHGDMYGEKACPDLPQLLQARKRFAYGTMRDYFSGHDRNRVGFVRSGDERHPGGCAVTLCHGGGSSGKHIRMNVGTAHAGVVFVDFLDQENGKEVVIRPDGSADFPCDRSVSVFVPKGDL